MADLANRSVRDLAGNLDSTKRRPSLREGTLTVSGS